jgi:GR25 family glycosyltransferase involved in LPS biosynthesis
MAIFSKKRTARFRTSTIVHKINNATSHPRTNVDATSPLKTDVDDIQSNNTKNTNNEIIESKVEKYFRTMYCVNLESRPDRWRQTVEEFKKLGPDYTLNRFNAIRNTRNPELGCATSFLTLIQMAKDQNMPAILVGEDDIMLYSKSAEMWEKAISELPDNWDVLSGGTYIIKNRMKVSSTLYKVNNITCMHYICIRNTCYDKILSYFKNNMGKQAIDRFIGELSQQKKINVYLVWPMIAGQRPSYSNLEHKNVDYHKTYRYNKLLFLSD